VLDETSPASATAPTEVPVGRPAVAAPAPLAGADRYVLLERVGEGGMGVVYAAYDHVLDRKVAFKVLHERLLGGAHQDRLLREARAMAQLSHPNVVPVYDAGEADGRLYLTMEFVRGRTLDAWLREPRTLDQIVDVFRAAGRGLAAAHATGIVHRDVKPSNILIGDDGRVRVADFGVARGPAAPSTSGAPTQTGVAGSPAYMAPEQLRGAAVDARADQFGLCVSLYEALHGRRPFAATSYDDLLTAIERGPAPGSRALPAWIARAIDRGLAVEPSQRFADMDALLAALAPPTPRRRRVAAVALVAAIAIGGGVAWAARGSGDDGPHCETAGAELDAIWSPARRDRVIAALGGGDGPRLATRIDAYAGDWRGARQRACRAARVDRVWPSELEPRAVACLDEPLRRLRLTVDALERGGPGASAVALDAVAKLAPTRACGDPDYLRSAVAPIVDPARRARVTAVHDRIVGLWLAQQLGRAADVVRDLPALRGEAAALDHPPTAARLAMFEGDLARDRGDAAAATAAHTAAYVAARTARDPVVATAAASALIWDHSQFGEDRGRAADWGQIAAAEMAPLGDHYVAANVHYALGALAMRGGDADRAVAEFGAAAAIALREFGPDHYYTGQLRSALAQQLGAVGRFADAVEPGRAAVAIIERWIGPTSKRLVRPLSGLARSESYAGLHDAALADARRAVAIAEAAGDGELVADALVILGGALSQAGRDGDAVAILQRAHDGFTGLGRTAAAAKTAAELAAARARHALVTGGAGAAAAAIAELETARDQLVAAKGTDLDVAAADAAAADLLARSGRCADARPHADHAIAVYDRVTAAPVLEAVPRDAIGRCTAVP